MVKSFNEIMRDFETDGVPSSGLHQVIKADMRVWGTYIESLTMASSYGNTAWFATKSLLNADLAHDAGTSAIVYADTTSDNNGIYIKSGASGTGSWGQILTYLPGYQFVIATDVGTGTANAIVATTSPSVTYTDGAQLISLKIFETTTSSVVTVNFNGLGELRIKTASNNDPVAGGLIAGMTVLGVVSGSNFQLVSDQSSAAIQAAAESALADFRSRWVGDFVDDTAADAYLTGAGLTKLAGTAYFNTTSDVWRYWDGSAWQPLPYATVAPGSVTEDKLSVPLQALVNATTTSIATRTALKALTIPSAGDTVILTESGREGVFIFKSGDYSAEVTADTQEGIFIKATDTAATSGAWVRHFDGEAVMIEWFGGKRADTAFDNKAAFDAAIALMTAVNIGILKFQNGTYNFLTAPAPITVGIHLKGGGHSSSETHGGTVLDRNFNQTSTTPFLQWTGTGIAFNSTGGGMSGFTVRAANGTSGGTGVLLYATSDTQRPGYMSFRDLAIFGTGTGTWVQAMEINGQNCTTAGSQGIRDIALNSVWLAGATTNTLILINAVQALLDGVHVYQASGSVSILRISGLSATTTDKTTNLTGNVAVLGDLILGNCQNVSLTGLVTNINASSESTTGSFNGVVTGTTTNTSASFKIRTQATT